MRKLLFSALFAASCLTMNAQNLDDVQEKIAKKKYDEAKEKIDKMLNEPKHQKNANAWYQKGIVYYELAQDSTKDNSALLNESYNAFRKYYELDPKNITGTLEQNARLFQLYETHYNKGIHSYQRQQFDQAYQGFRNALQVEEFIASKGFAYNGFSFPALDTTLILNVAAMALKANQEDEATKYYQRLADAKIKGNNYNEVYQMLVEYYGKKNDAANRSKYLALGKELYPESDYWLEVDLVGLREDKPKLFAKYEELNAANPGKYYLAYNYAVELYNYVYANDKKPADAATYEPKIAPAIEKAIAAQSTADANLLMVRYLSEKIFRMEDELRTIRGTKPEDVKKKQTINTTITKSYDQLAPYAETVFTLLSAKTDMKGGDKANLRYVTNVLIDYYTMKKQADKVKFYQDKLKQA